MRKILAMLVVACAATAMADTMTVMSNTATFSTDQAADQVISAPKFDTLGGTRVLNFITIELFHSGSADIAGDNDDVDDAASGQARLIRQADVTGITDGTYSRSASENALSPITAFAADDGDLGVFDSSAPDGASFPGLSFADVSEGTDLRLPSALYQGVGTVDFNVDTITIAQDFTFQGQNPDAFQIEVENPLQEVYVKLTYDYTVVPEPASLMLLGLSVLVLRRR
jgi:hypothetical protein